MIKRRILFVAFLGYLAAPLIAGAQDPAKIAKVGHLSSGRVGQGIPRLPILVAFYQGLHELGWIEGKNLVIEWAGAEGKVERLPELARELVRRKVDVIVVTACGAPLNAARRATSTIPIVVTTCADDMVADGIVASLARPGGNVTGQSKMTPELTAKRLALMKELLPAVSRVGVLWPPDYSDFAADWRALRETARQLGITLHSAEARRPTEIEPALVQLRHEGAEALITFSDALVFVHAKTATDVAAKIRLPAIYAYREAVDVGGLMSYGPNGEHMFRRAASYVDKILRGAKPGDLPIEQPTKVELIINLKVAKSLGLTVPPSLLLRADQVIE